MYLNMYNNGMLKKEYQFLGVKTAISNVRLIDGARPL